jgi:hypothetical protein
MQLRAPLYDSDALTDKSVELSYTLDSRPLSTDQVGSVAGIVRVRVELLDLHGNLVSPNAVAVDLLTYQDGNHHITRIRVEPARGGHQDDRFAQKSRPWVVKYWKTQFGSLFESSEKTTQPKNGIKTTSESAKPAATAVADQEESESKFAISSFWAAPAHSNYRDHRRPHHHRPGNAFVRIVRPIILPAVLGAIAGLTACLVGFFLGHVVMSFASRLGWKTRVAQRSAEIEEGSFSEKSPMAPNVYVTDVAGSV